MQESMCRMNTPLEPFVEAVSHPEAPPDLKRVLWVEPDSYVRESLNEFIHNFCNTQQLQLRWYSVGSLEEAWQVASQLQHPIDVVLIEPDFALEFLQPWLQALRERYPELRVALFTQRSVDDYLTVCNQLAIPHVLLKSIPFSFQEFQAALKRLCLPETTLAIEQLLPEPISESIEFTIENTDDIMLVFSSLNELLQHRLSCEVAAEVCTPLLEGLTNSVYHAIKADAGEDKYLKGSVIDKLEDAETVQVTFMETENYVAVTIRDQGGSLELNQVMYLLARNISGEGIFDETGRGLFLMYTLMDAFFITVVPQQQTHVTLVKNKNRSLEIPSTASPYDVTLPNRPITFYQV